MTPGKQALVDDMYHQQEMYVRFRVTPVGGASGLEVTSSSLNYPIL